VLPSESEIKMPPGTSRRLDWGHDVTASTSKAKYTRKPVNTGMLDLRAEVGDLSPIELGYQAGLLLDIPWRMRDSAESRLREVIAELNQRAMAVLGEVRP
jgi:hypothetical protein